MSTEDKRKRQDDTADSPATDQRDAVESQGIEDAEVIAETPPKGETAGASSVEATPETTAEDAAAAIEGQTVPGTTPGAEPVADTTPPDGAAAADPAPEPDPAPKAAPTPAPVAAPSHGGGVLSTVFGGVLAAIIGFGAAQFIHVDWLGMSGFGKDPVAGALDSQANEIAALRTRLDEVQAAAADTAPVQSVMTGIAEDMTSRFAAVSDQMGTLNGEFSGLSERVSGVLGGAETQLAQVAEALGNVENRMAGVGDRLDGLDGRLAAVDERLVAVEKRPLVESSDTAKAAFEAYERQLDELRGILTEQRTDADALESRMTEMSATAAAQMTALQEEAEGQIKAVQSQTEAQIAEAQAEAEARVKAAEEKAAQAEAEAQARAEHAVALAALAQVQAALNAGIAYETALPALQAVAEVPAVIAGNGGDGIPTLEQLQERFPDLARDALDVSLETTMTADAGDRLVTFLRNQAGLRSTEAREGTDPDAVLSRMQAAVDDGNLDGAIAEYDGLPEAGQAVLATWIQDARDRVAAQSALPELAATLNAN